MRVGVGIASSEFIVAVGGMRVAVAGIAVFVGNAVAVTGIAVCVRIAVADGGIGVIDAVVGVIVNIDLVGRGLSELSSSPRRMVAEGVFV